LGSASVWAMAPASVGVASLIISLCVTFGGASVAIISYPLKMVSLAIALVLCQLIRQEFFTKPRVDSLNVIQLSRNNPRIPDRYQQLRDVPRNHWSCDCPLASRHFRTTVNRPAAKFRRR